MELLYDFETEQSVLYNMSYIAGDENSDMLKSENLGGMGNYATCRSNLGLALSTIVDNRIKEIGRGVLVLGTVVITTTNATATADIFLTAQNGTINVGAVWVSARTASDFTISSSNALDARTVAYIIFEP